MKPWLAVLAILLLCAAVVFAVFSQKILWAMGAMLVDDEAPEKADIVVVLGGDLVGNRVLEGVKLVRQGFAPRMLLSGPAFVFGVRECQREAEFAIHQGWIPAR